MHIETDELVIRDFQRKDAEALYRIVREKEIVRFMKDWSEHAGKPEDYYAYIDWLQTKAESTDVRPICNPCQRTSLPSQRESYARTRGAAVGGKTRTAPAALQVSYRRAADGAWCRPQL